MSWYNTNPKNVIDARLPLLGAEAMGKGFRDFGNAAFDTFGESQALKVAKVNANAKLKVSKNDKEIAGIRRDTEKYKSDMAYKRAWDTANINAKAKKTAAAARVKAAELTGKAKKYYADILEKNNIRSTTVSRENNIRTNKRKNIPKLDLKDKSDIEVLKKIKEAREDIGDMEL